MKYCYYPGCTLKTQAKELDRAARTVAAALGLTLVEPPEWQCCGAVYPLAEDEIGSRLAAVRTLVYAREQGLPLLTLCSACHHVLKRVNADMRENARIRDAANRYLELDPPYQGEAEVVHYLELLRDRVGWAALASRVKQPLSGRNIGAYYGCLLLRPSAVLRFDDPEQPRVLEDLLAALGATPVRYGARNECCGAYLSLADETCTRERAQSVLQDARDQGAELLVTACPLCRYNLMKNSAVGAPPVAYFTELLAQALAVAPAREEVRP